MDLIAHRGASYDAPENTLRAIRLAWEQDPDGIEVDVVLSKDDQIVLMHDINAHRTTGVDVHIRDWTWAELQKLDVGSWKGLQFAGERIPLLEQVLATVPSGKCVYIDVKCGSEIVPHLKKLVVASRLQPDRIFLVGEFLDIMQPIKRTFPDHPVYWNVDLNKKEDRDPLELARQLAQESRSAGLDGLGLRAHRMIDTDFMKTLKGANQSLFVWTVNDPAEAARMAGLGARSLATDRPGWLRERMYEV